MNLFCFCCSGSFYLGEGGGALGVLIFVIVSLSETKKLSNRW